MQCVTLPRITELNPHLLCVLCGGYYIDATSIIECLHAFCKSCIVRYLETHKYCPICDVLVHKTEPLQNIRPDVIRQSIVYKLVPNLYKKEMRNRRNFYVQVNPQLHPACSESKGEITESSNFFSTDDLINLSLEYVNSINEKNFFCVAKGSKRYFRCRAAVTIRSLRRLLAAKYALGVGHKINLYYDGIQLPDHFKLLDIAYISSWKRVGCIRILYEILTVDPSLTSVEKVDLTSQTESLVDERKDEDEKDTNAVSPAGDVNKPENPSRVSKEETIIIDISDDRPERPCITIDLISPPRNAANVNTSDRPSNDDVVANSNPEPHPSATPPPEPIAADEESTEGEVVSVAPIDNADTQPSEEKELCQKTETIESNEKKDEAEEPRVDDASTSIAASNDEASSENKTPSREEARDETPSRDEASSRDESSSNEISSRDETSSKDETSSREETSPEDETSKAETPSKDETPAETNASAPAVGEGMKTNSLPPPVSCAPHEDEAEKVAPVKATAAEGSAVPKSGAKKERRNARSDALPPVPALRMISSMPKTSAVKPLTTSVSIGLTQPVVSIPRITSAPRVSSKTTSRESHRYAAPGASTPLSLIAPPLHTATDLISLYAKSPTARTSPVVPTPKKPTASSSSLSNSSGGGCGSSSLSILRIDPKTLSPIEATSSPTSVPALLPAIGVGGGGGGAAAARKMLPCRPITSSAFVNSGVYSCAGGGGGPLHPSYGKFSSPPPPLYPPFPPSSLHPMNELMRRMFPFSFGPIDPLKSALEPSAACGLSPYPQSISSAVSHFLQAKPPPPAAAAVAPAKPTKGERGRRKSVAQHPPPPPALNGAGREGAYKPSGYGRGGRRGNATATANGQVKSAVKRKNSELSDFSINNLIPAANAKRAPPARHACTADGVNLVCDQLQPVSALLGNESRKSS